MKQTVYIDVLICLNLFVNYFLLLCCGKFLNLRIQRKRLLLASLTGAVFSLYIFLPPLPFIVGIPIQLIMASVIVTIGFKITVKKMFFKVLCCFFSINFAFAGSVFLLWKFISPRGLFMNNGVVYLNISPLILIVSTICSYFMIRFLNRVTGRAQNEMSFCYLKIKKGNKECNLYAKVDSGNDLCEPFSNLPVVVVRFKDVQSLFSLEEKKIFLKNNNFKVDKETLNLNIRVVPFKTISGFSTLLAFKPDSIYIKQKDKDVERLAYVGVCTNNTLGEITALVNPELLY